MNVIHVGSVIFFIDNGVFPKTPLPTTAFMAFDSDLGAIFCFRDRF